MERRHFLFATLGALAAIPTTVRAQDELYDPEMNAPRQALRVLLGSGDAVANPQGGFTFNGRPYRGTFVRDPDGQIITTVGLEEYLYSVVPREMTASWPAAALRAQAICARTYVLQRSAPRRAYDLVPSEADQVYGGMASESPAAREAVDASAGQVLQFNGHFAQVMYSSCCGGHTEASSDAWGGAPFPYLGGVVCTYCTASPNYRWHRDLALSAITTAFASEIGAYGELTNVRTAATDASGRARTVELACERGSAFVKGSVFRARLGYRTIPSLLITKIDVSTEAPQRVAIEGGGLGHGVGLCQWGARGMALAGASADDILRFYFPGTTIGHD
ncbi:MAG TPA: SpoIID/LytB domain-containing protein [Candidatus Aquilonibacter sp.]|nr:SpoIID/LytB domain-containing protein [Candidatus Aquilonibacter sp.]